MFTVLDLILYFAIYFIASFLLNRPAFASATEAGASNVVGRLLFLQAPLQFFSLMLVFRYLSQPSGLVILATSLACFFLPLAILSGDAAIVLKFAELYRGFGNLGPAWVLAISTLLSWLILFKLTGLSRLFALAP